MFCTCVEQFGRRPRRSGHRQSSSRIGHPIALDLTGRYRYLAAQIADLPDNAESLAVIHALNRNRCRHFCPIVPTSFMEDGWMTPRTARQAFRDLLGSSGVVDDPDRISTYVVDQRNLLHGV